MNRHYRLADDRPAIELRTDEVDGAAGKAHPRVERLPLGIEPAEGRQQRGMNVDHPVAPSLDKAPFQHPHEPGKADELDTIFTQQCFRLRCEGAWIAMRERR